MKSPRILTRNLHRIPLPTPQPIRRPKSTSTPEPSQAFPLTGFYLDLLTHPLTPANPPPPSSVTPRPPPNTPATEPFSPQPPTISTEHSMREAKARIVFGSRLAGPGQSEVRKGTKEQRGEMVAGVWIPPRPEEPDNCCMSGCVNCVLSQFVEDLDEWQEARREAKRRMALAVESEGDGVSPSTGGEGEGLWEGFEDIPVGLRAFMETEKRLAKGRKG